MINVFLIIAVLFIGLIVYLLLKNNNIFTKILLLNSLTSVVTLFICFLGSFKVNNSYLDIAIIYFLLSFIASSAYLRYFIDQSNKVTGDRSS
jgi:multisubunit Na+/H+ antiporter MnhF subunit